MLIPDLWRHEAGKYFCIATKTKAGVWHDKFFHRSELDKVADYVREHRDRNVYFCPHGFSTNRPPPGNRSPRVKENAVLPSLLWSDMDAVDPGSIQLRPTIAIESSPGRFVGLWECDGVVTEELNKRLTYTIGADKSGHDLTQVLRVPGTINYKYAAEPRVRLLWDDGPTYSINEMNIRLQRLKPERKARADTGGGLVKASANVKELMRAYGVKNMCMGHAGDRSKAIYGIWSPMVEGGATLDQVLRVLEASRSWQSKLADDDGWCEAEIERIEREIG